MTESESTPTVVCLGASAGGLEALHEFFEAYEALTPASEVTFVVVVHLEPLRVWVAGCSTGQEVYTLVMLLHETMAHHGCPRELRMFATDFTRMDLVTCRNLLIYLKPTQGISHAGFS